LAGLLAAVQPSNRGAGGQNRAIGDHGAAAEAAARRLAFTLAAAWMGGLLHQAGKEVRLRGIGLPPQ